MIESSSGRSILDADYLFQYFRSFYTTFIDIPMGGLCIVWQLIIINCDDNKESDIYSGNDALDTQKTIPHFESVVE